jgi:thermitase
LKTPFVIALVLLAAPLAYAIGPASAASPHAYVVAFESLPAERGHYGGAPVVGASEDLRFLVVMTDNPHALEAIAHDDANVRYVVEDLEAMHATLVPNDAYYAQLQYDMKPATTNMEAAWSVTLGASAVKLCIVDTGQDRSHEDLSSLSYWYWKDEVNGKATPYDDNGHGTHVTGTAAARANNGLGVAGIAPGATIGAVKVLGRTGSGTWTQVANGIVDCANAGAHVESISIGGGASSVLQDAVTYATGRGVFIAAAAGNSGPCTNCVDYPGAYAAVVAVACSDASNRQCSFSSEGPQVDLTAPGDSIASTWPAGKSPCRKPDGNHCYVYSSGTSMSTPHVAGLAALYLSAHPGSTAAQIEAALKAGARDLGLSAAKQGSGLIQGTVV